jgi:hypothetical protein
MSSQPHTVLASVLRVMRPLARLLLRHGVTYPAFSAALKRVFLEAAQAELAGRGMSQTDSAVTLLSGVHRRDVRNLTRGPAPRRAAALEAREPLGLVGQVVARWLSEAAMLDADGAPRRLPRSGAEPSFDSLVASVSSDVRPRAMLDEMLRLGVASEDDDGVALLADGFAPRQGLAESAALLAANLHDHAAAAVANLQGDANFVEQAIYVDQITADSADALHRAAAMAWKLALKTVMRQAQTRFDTDAATAAAADRKHRARFGVYFFSEQEE